jgi:hypothetical protein
MLIDEDTMKSSIGFYTHNKEKGTLNFLNKTIMQEGASELIEVDPVNNYYVLCF